MEAAPSPTYTPKGPPPDRPADEYPLYHEDGSVTVLVYYMGAPSYTQYVPPLTAEERAKAAEIQAFFAKYRPTDGTLTTDELFAERRAEALNE